MTTNAEQMQFEGPCPFLTCLETKAHAHPICQDCGAVRYGNLFCKTCNDYNRANPRRIEEDMKLWQT